MKLADSTLLKQHAFLDGQWVSADAGAAFDVLDPATGERLASVPDLGAAETERAIRVAEAGQKAWAKLSGKERAAPLRRWFELMVQHADDLAMIMTREQGKPLAEAKGEVIYAASFIEWFAEEAKRVSGEVLAHPQADKRIAVLRQPVGVCAAITPWNFPAAMITRKVGPALAAGCAMIVKPAEQTPLSALALAELAVRAGIPGAVFQVLTTSDARTMGGVLTASPVVRKLSFTGSTEVGRILMAQSAPTVKRLSLELGGNAPFIVFDDADLDAAVEGAMISKYRNAGQTCVCANRFYVQAGIYDRFAEKLAAKAAELKVGNGLDAVALGPLIDQPALDKVHELVADALGKGARVVTGGQDHALGGTYYQPTVLADTTPDMRVAREEIFGPVAPLFRFERDEDAIALANATEFGLAAYLYSQNLSRAWRTAEALEVGMVGVNTGLISNEVGPFGGVKQSGLGREGSHLGIDEYLEVKYLAFQV